MWCIITVSKRQLKSKITHKQKEKGVYTEIKNRNKTRVILASCPAWK